MHKSAGIDVKNAAALDDMVLTAFYVQNTQKRHASGLETVEDQNKGLKSESVVGQQLQDHQKKFATGYPNIGVVKWVISDRKL